MRILLNGMETSRARPFFEEFAALYAPQFHAAYVSIPFDYASPLFQAYTSLLLGLTQSSAGKRFYPERPFDFSRVLDITLRAIMAGVPVDLQDEWMSCFNDSRAAFHLFGSLHVISSLYFPQDLSPSPSFGRIKLHLPALRRLLAALTQECHDEALARLELMFIADLIRFATGQQPPAAARRQAFLAAASWGWCCCELGVESDSGARCDVLAEGREMDACGRCRAVRYCSREHQRAHWKEHKKFCFTPTF